MNILITGVSRGIGRELVLKFAQNPNNNIVVFSSNSEQAKALSQKCEQEFNNKITHYTLNFLAKNIDELLLAAFSQIDIVFDVVINNAGKLINQPFLKNTLPELEELHRINFVAPYLICQNIVKQNTTTSCHIVNIGSMGGVQGSVKFPGLSVYSATKAALANLTECLAEELKDTNVKINCLALGSAQTEMLQEAFPGYQSQVSAKQMADYIFQFSTSGGNLFNGKIIPVSITTP
jgi:short-subunit dehydrogenase